MLYGLIILAVLLFLTLPRYGKRHELQALRAYLIAHRGFHDASAPENSMAAFSRAVEAGYAIELDVHLSRDGEVVVFHDDTLTRMTGDERHLAQCTLEELKALRLAGSDERIPTLEEVLALAQGHVPLLIEMKGESTATALASALVPILDVYDGPFAVQSFNPMLLSAMRKLRPEIVRGLLATNFLRDPSVKVSFATRCALEWKLTNFLARPDFLSFNHAYPKNVSSWWLRNIYKMPAAAWTIRSEEEMHDAAKEYGGIIFEHFRPEESEH